MTEDGSTLGPLERDRRAPFAVGERARSWGDLLADAGRIAARLRPLLGRSSETGAPPPIMLACADRYHGAACLLAIWDVARIAALPPNGREETIDALCAERGIDVLLHDGGGRGGIDVRPWLEGATSGPAAPPVEPPRFAASQPVACLFTSGSTGAHVPCLKAARQLLGEARLLVSLFDMGPEARVLATVPPHHIYGLLFGVLVPLMGGGALVRGTPQHAETIAADARRFGANVLCSVPAHLQGLGVLGPGALPPLRRIFSSGAPLPEEVAHAVAGVAGVPVTEVFGSSETGGIAWRQQRPTPTGDRRLDDDAAGEGDGAVSLWQAFPGIEVSADADGLMVVRSPFADTPEGGPAGAPVRGADRVRVASGGRFELLGRADGVVKIGGSRIAVGEVERRLREIPGVREAAVISVEVAGLRRHELWAAVVAPGLTAPALREALRRRLESIAVPRRFRLVEALPREENGKLMKARLRALFAAPAAPEGPASSPAPAGSEGAAAASPASPAPKADGRERHEVTVTIAADSPFFGGHFDGFPVLPGVVQLNNLILHNVRLRWPGLEHLRKVMALKFRNPIRPLDPLSILLERTEAHRVRFEIRSGARVMSSGSLVFAAAAGSPEPRPGPAG